MRRAIFTQYTLISHLLQSCALDVKDQELMTFTAPRAFIA